MINRRTIQTIERIAAVIMWLAVFVAAWGVAMAHTMPPPPPIPPAYSPATNAPEGDPPPFGALASDMVPPAPPPGEEPMGEVLLPQTNVVYVLNTSAVTNAGTVTWINNATVTNIVKRPEPVLVVRVMESVDLTKGWTDTGKEFIVLLGTNPAAFYTAKMEIR